jgi:predicted CopG family antitoxin
VRKKITLTIDSDVYDNLEELPRKVSVSEFVNLMLKGYIETFKRGHILSQEEVDEILEELGGEDFKQRLRSTFPTLDKAVNFSEFIKDITMASVADKVKI